jgi:hypothetical protein
MKFRMCVPPLKGGRLRPLRELKRRVRPVGGWRRLGLEFNTAEELVDWVCGHIFDIEPDRHKTYRRWVYFCYMRRLEVPVFKWYLRLKPDQFFRHRKPWLFVTLARRSCNNESVGYKIDEVPRDPAAIVEALCRHINARIAVPCDSRSVPYFTHWILYCVKMSASNLSSSSASLNDSAK